MSSPLLWSHVGISLVAIAAGFVVLAGMLGRRPLPGWTAWFLVTTALTSVTGFLFPYKGITPGIVIGVISMGVLGLSAYARYARRLSGIWRAVYVVTAVLALYLNVLVLIVQSFQKLFFLRPLAGAPLEPAVQVLAMLGFLVAGVLSVRRYREVLATAAA